MNTTLRPGHFQASCRQPRWVPFTELLEVNPDSTQSRWDKKLAQNVFLVHCAFVTSDRSELEAHMKAVHDGGRNRWDNGSIDPNITAVRNYKPRTELPVKLWKGPKLTEAGKPFEPTGLEVGGRVEWDGRTGQVWSLGHVPKSVWVVPDEPSTQTKEGAGTRHELAALLVVTSSGRLLEHDNSWSSWKLEAA